MAIALPRWAIASWKAERRKAWSPALPHHSIASIVETGLGEVMSDRFGLGVRLAQRVGGATVQRLPAALEQALVGGVLDQRVLEAVWPRRRGALDEQEVGLREPIQSGLQAQLVESGCR